MKYNELRSVHHFKDSLVEGEEEGEGRGRGETVNKYYRQLASVCALAMDTQVCTVTSTHWPCVTPAVRGKVCRPEKGGVRTPVHTEANKTQYNQRLPFTQQLATWLG